MFMDLSLYFEAHEILSTSSQGLLSTSGQVRCITRQPPLLHAWCGSACAQYHQHEADEVAGENTTETVPPWGTIRRPLADSFTYEHHYLLSRINGIYIPYE